MFLQAVWQLVHVVHTFIRRWQCHIELFMAVSLYITLKRKPKLNFSHHHRVWINLHMLYIIDHLNVWEFQEQLVGSGLFMCYPHPFLIECVQWHYHHCRASYKSLIHAGLSFGLWNMSCKQNWQACGLSHYRLQLYYSRHLKCFKLLCSYSCHLCKVYICAKGTSLPPPSYQV